MAEFEQGYCTGCGVKTRRWGHRPFCWRYITMKHDIEATRTTIILLNAVMLKHWRIRAWFLVKPEHIYYYPSGKGLNDGKT